MCRFSRQNARGSSFQRLPMTASGTPACAQIGLQRPAAGQGADVHLELVARQPAGQQAQLLLGPGAVQRRYDLENAFGH